MEAAMTQPTTNGKPTLRLVHSSDLHLETPMYGLAEVPAHLRELLIEAPYQAAEQVFETALAEDADGLLLAGDVLNVDRAASRRSTFRATARQSRASKARAVATGARSRLGASIATPMDCSRSAWLTGRTIRQAMKATESITWPLVDGMTSKRWMNIPESPTTAVRRRVVVRPKRGRTVAR
jgi:hypothetical protein